MRNRYLAFFFALLLIFILGQAAYAQTLENEEDAAASSVSKLDYSELNTMIDGIIFQKINAVVQFIKKYLLIVWTFFLALPSLIKTPIIIAFFPACIGIIASHVIGIYRNKNKWQKHPNYDLMYSYFIQSGALQRKNSYLDAHALLKDHKWLLFSFAGLAFRLGNYANRSIMLMFAMSFVYIPLSIVGFIEMVLRVAFGTVWLWVFGLIHRFLLFVTKLISYLLIPIANIIDKVLRNTQYCPHCYDSFALPEFVCPACGKVHKQLLPGNCGVLFVRCSCNKTFLPCTSFTGRSHLTAKCPSCSGELVAANPKHLSITVIGENDTEKAVFIEAFSDLGRTVIESETHTYSILPKHGRSEKDNLVFYDTFAEHVIAETFPRSPKYFGFCDGIVVLIDPLSTENNVNAVVVSFNRHYYRISGFPQGKMSDVPVAILINNADVGEGETYRDYLAKVGLINLLNNIDATFTNVNIFPVNVIGQQPAQGKKYSLVSIIKPIEWIAQKKGSRLAAILHKTEESV